MKNDMTSFLKVEQELREYDNTEEAQKMDEEDLKIEIEKASSFWREKDEN